MAFKVLLVEDDNNLREIYEARLQAEGYNIVTARDGEEALGVAKAEVPDLVISDVMMPRVSGFEMLDILRNTDNLKDVKVIMLTALGQADDKTRANSLGADRYLVKSQVTLEDIVKTAHELLGDTASEAAAAPAPTTPPAAPPTSPSPSVAPSLNVTPAPAPMTAPMSVAPVPAPAVVSAPPTAPAFSPTVGVSQPPVVPEPPRAAQAPVMPAPTPPPMPGVTPAPAPMAAPMPTPTPVAPTAPSTSEEKATIDTQIDNFVRSAPDTTPTADPNSPSSQDDAVLADAMQDLAATAKPDSEGDVASATTPGSAPAPVAPEPVTPTLSPQPIAAPNPVTPPSMPSPVAPPAPAEPPVGPEDRTQSSSNSVIIANKKIIQPLSSAESKPSIHELAAREEASGTPAPGMTSPATTFTPNVPVPPMPPASPVVGGPGVVPAPQPPQAPPANPGSFDPNSISL